MTFLKRRYNRLRILQGVQVPTMGHSACSMLVYKDGSSTWLDLWFARNLQEGAVS